MQRSRLVLAVVLVFAAFLLLGASQRSVVEGRFRLVNYETSVGSANVWAQVMMIDSEEGKTWILGNVKGSKATPLWIPVAVHSSK